jgi:O-methyltransferase
MTHPRSTPAIDRLTSWDGADEIYRALHRGVEYAIVAAVDGHIAEFGTSSGKTAMTLAKALSDYGSVYALDQQMHNLMPRKLMLFDGFEGFPPAMHPIDKASPHVAAGVWGPGVTKDAGPGLLREMCATFIDESRIEIHEGWYSETIPKLEPGLKFAMVHIDCDFYASTMDVLDRLFVIDAFSDGCAIFFDDWYCNRGSPDFGEQKAWADCVAKFKPRYTDWGPYATVGRRFIIHR